MTIVEPLLSGDRSAGNRLDPTARPRLGFLGVGWIGRSRMEAIAQSGFGEICAIADPSAEMAAAALQTAPSADTTDSIEALLEMPLDGIVIASPSALHASQAIAALERGMAVFCQKPLGRTAAEVERVVDAARSADRLLGVDFYYRFVNAFGALREVVASGEIGRIYAADLTFHNAYGPDKPWFYDPALSGGGCVMDLGIHLVDTACWVTGAREARHVSSRLFAGGRPADPESSVEDFATATIDFETGLTAHLACSWNLSAGRDAIIEVTFFGTDGGVSVKNVNGSFYDFVTERYRGTATERIAEPPDAWGGRAAVEWAERLARGERFGEESALELVEVARVVDRIYGR